MRMRAVLLLFFGFFCQALQGEENFIFIDGQTSKVIQEFGPHIEERVTPACSFNIALSLMGYEAGVLQDEQTPTWDFQEGYDDSSESWKSSQTPQTWMTRSCVWYSKVIALHLGLETIQEYLALLEYGNQDLSAGMAQPGPANAAWINASLKISPKEQVDFIQKMVHGNLPISSKALQRTKILLWKEELAGGWQLYGKTGMGSIVGEDGDPLKVKWFVGWIENGNTCFPFAYQMRAKGVDVTQTVPRVKQLLVEQISLILAERAGYGA